MSRDAELLLETRAQQAALRSPVRQEVLSQLVLVSDASVAELAEAMGVAADGLYFHLAKLVEAGLVEEVPRQGMRGKTYRAVADRFAFPHAGDDATNRRALAAVSTSMRQVHRDLARALESRSATRSGPERNLWSARMRCRLSADELRQVNDHLNAIEAVVVSARNRALGARSVDQAIATDGEPDGQHEDFYSLFLALTPSPARRP